MLSIVIILAGCISESEDDIRSSSFFCATSVRRVSVMGFVVSPNALYADTDFSGSVTVPLCESPSDDCKSLQE